MDNKERAPWWAYVLLSIVVLVVIAWCVLEVMTRIAIVKMA